MRGIEFVATARITKVLPVRRAIARSADAGLFTKVSRSTGRKPKRAYQTSGRRRPASSAACRWNLKVVTTVMQVHTRQAWTLTPGAVVWDGVPKSSSPSSAGCRCSRSDCGRRRRGSRRMRRLGDRCSDLHDVARNRLARQLPPVSKGARRERPRPLLPCWACAALNPIKAIRASSVSSTSCIARPSGAPPHV